MQLPIPQFPSRPVTVNPKFPSTPVTVNPSNMLSLIRTVAQHNLALGRQIGYRQGRHDERDNKPWPREMKEK